jgi:predicted P-loop ATPase/GTPase
VFQEKGFKVVCATTETDFLNNLQNSDEAWIVSDEKSPSQAFLDAIKQYHESGRGLALWADNEPWTATVNDILKAIQSKVKEFKRTKEEKKKNSIAFF